MVAGGDRAPIRSPAARRVVPPRTASGNAMIAQSRVCVKWPEREQSGDARVRAITSHPSGVAWAVSFHGERQVWRRGQLQLSVTSLLDPLFTARWPWSSAGTPAVRVFHGRASLSAEDHLPNCLTPQGGRPPSVARRQQRSAGDGPTNQSQ